MAWSSSFIRDKADHLETTSHSKLPVFKKDICPLETSLHLLKSPVITLSWEEVLKGPLILTIYTITTPIAPRSITGYISACSMGTGTHIDPERNGLHTKVIARLN